MALPTSIELRVVTPDRLIVKEAVDEIQIPGSEGYFGVLPGHTPMLASLAVGEMWYRKGQEKTFLALAFGFCEVLPDRVTILARFAERAEEVDVERAEEARKRAARAALEGQGHRLRTGAPRADEIARAAAGLLTQPVRRPRRQAAHAAAAGLGARMKLSWAVRTDPGLRRSSNEDSYCTRPDLGLFVVADGMGGHVAGEVASRLAVETIQTFIAETAGADKNRTWPFPFEPQISLEGNRLKAAFRLANRQIANAMADSVDLRGMATTASAVLVGKSSACVGHVGDSRVYALRDGTLRQITDDHSWVEEQVRAGTMTATAARQHPWRNVVTRALSGGTDPEVDTVELVPAQGRAVPALFRRPVGGRAARGDRADPRRAGEPRSGLRSPDRRGERGGRSRQHHRPGARRRRRRCSITSRSSRATGR